MHVAVPAVVPVAKVHGVKVPVTPETERITVPPGVVGFGPVSVTVALQPRLW